MARQKHNKLLDVAHTNRNLLVRVVSEVGDAELLDRPILFFDLDLPKEQYVLAF